MITLGDYKHFKGTTYTVICLAKHSETLESMIVYTKGDGTYWVRPEAMFEEEVEWPDGVKRARFMPVSP